MNTNEAFYHYHIMCELVHLREKGLIDTSFAEDDVIITAVALITQRIKEIQDYDDGLYKIPEDLFSAVAKEVFLALFPKLEQIKG